MCNVFWFSRRLSRGTARNSYGGRVDETVPGMARVENHRRGRRRTEEDTTRLLPPRSRRIYMSSSVEALFQNILYTCTFIHIYIYIHITHA